MAEEIVFDGSLYLPDAIAAAAEAYAQLVRVELTPTADAIVAKLSGFVAGDPGVIVNAFCNHALYETIVRRRQADQPEDAS
jgi:hypothetical protein